MCRPQGTAGADAALRCMPAVARASLVGCEVAGVRGPAACGEQASIVPVAHIPTRVFVRIRLQHEDGRGSRSSRGFV